MTESSIFNLASIDPGDGPFNESLNDDVTDPLGESNPANLIFLGVSVGFDSREVSNRFFLVGLS